MEARRSRTVAARTEVLRGYDQRQALLHQLVRGASALIHRPPAHPACQSSSPHPPRETAVSWAGQATSRSSPKLHLHCWDSTKRLMRIAQKPGAKGPTPIFASMRHSISSHCTEHGFRTTFAETSNGKSALRLGRSLAKVATPSSFHRLRNRSILCTANGSATAKAGAQSIVSIKTATQRIAFSSWRSASIAKSAPTGMSSLSWKSVSHGSAPSTRLLSGSCQGS